MFIFAAPASQNEMLGAPSCGATTETMCTNQTALAPKTENIDRMQMMVSVFAYSSHSCNRSCSKLTMLSIWIVYGLVHATLLKPANLTFLIVIPP